MSANKTANLQLNQWAAGDSFLREEFNEDNGKIDAAVQAIKDSAPMVKLCELNFTSPAQQVDIDVSGIEWGQYREVVLYVCCYIDQLGSASVFLQINGLSGQNYFVKQFGYSEEIGPFLGGCSACTRDRYGEGKFLFYPQSNFLAVTSLSMTDGALYNVSCGRCPSVPAPAAMHTISLCALNGNSFARGSATIYGIRK